MQDGYSVKSNRYIPSNSYAYLRGESEISLTRLRHPGKTGGKLFQKLLKKALSHNVSNHEENNTQT